MLLRIQFIWQIKCKFQRFFSTSNVNTNPYRAIPGPKSRPIVGNLFELKQFGGKLNLASLVEFLKTLNKKYGDVVKWKLFNRSQVFIFDPELAKSVYQVDGYIPERKLIRPWIFYYKTSNLSVPLFNSTGERWRKLRTAANPLAARPQTIYSYIDKHANVINEFTSLIDEEFRVANTVILNNFEKRLHFLALELISILTLDRRILCVNEKQREQVAVKLIKEIEIFFRQTAKLSVSLPIWMYTETKDRKTFFEAFDYLYKVISSHVNDASNRLLTNKQALETDEEKTILQQLIMNKDKYKVDMDDISAIVIDLLMAGFDTTSVTMHSLIYEIGRNPVVQERLFEEIKEHVNDGSRNEVNEDNLGKMRYLKLIVKEGLRLHTLLPVIGRVLQQDVILNGYLLPKGTNVSMCTITMCQSEKYFKNPTEFNPDRWLTDQIHPYASLPFGFGPRMCVGRRIAEQEIYILLIKLVQKYKIEYTGDKISYEFGSLMYPSKPLDIKLTKRHLSK